MALITCPECTNQVSDRASACPKCGFPIGATVSSTPIASTESHRPDQPADLSLDLNALIASASQSIEPDKRPARPPPSLRDSDPPTAAPLENPPALDAARESKASREQSSTGESEYYNDGGGVRITTTRIVMQNVTYPIANISSVSLWQQPRDLRGAYAILLLGIGMILGGLGYAASRQRNLPGGIGVFLAGVACVALGYHMWKTAKPSFSVRLTTTGGQLDALQSEDERYIAKIVTAINDAIVSRGW